jgi:hypothetical protein
MKDCPLSISDWFNYFQNYRHERIAIALGKSALIIPLIIFFLSYNFISGIHSTILNNINQNIQPSFSDIFSYIATLSAAFFSIFILYLILKKENFYYKSSQEMMKKIIDGENDSNKIRNEWLERINMPIKKRKSIFDNAKIDYALYTNRFFYVAFAFLVIGVILSAINFFGINAFDISAVFFTGGLGLLSISLAFHGADISKKSDKKVESMANVNFLQIVDMFENARMYFIAGYYDAETYTWKSKKDIEMAIGLLEKDKEKSYIEPKHLATLFDYFIISFNHFFKYTGWEKEKNSMTHLAQSYVMLEQYCSDENKKEFYDRIDEHIKDETIKKEFLALIQAAKARK